MGSNVVPPHCLVKLHQLDVNFWNISNVFWASNKQTICWDWFFDFWRLHLRSPILKIWCDEDVMIHYNNDNHAYCWAVSAQTFQTIEHNTAKISALLYTRNLYSYSHFEIFICIYSVRGEIDQMSTNTFRCSTCCAANVYIFVYILIGGPIVPLSMIHLIWVCFLNCVHTKCIFCYAIKLAYFSYTPVEG